MSKKLTGELLAAAVVAALVFWIAPNDYGGAFSQPNWGLKLGLFVGLACFALAAWRGAIPWSKLVTKRALMIEATVVAASALGAWAYVRDPLSPEAEKLNSMVDLMSLNFDREKTGEVTAAQSLSSFVAAQSEAFRNPQAREEVRRYRERHKLFCPSFLEMEK